ncbi:phage holin family protein [Leuconostoc fallax]|uniref:Phage holin family protein n=1 Tax=Leuconostoc fallax TaxID=1251 RepID=A0A4R5NAW8_9LACO|nr:phage holin family protein [Leuconostoc fallax]MBU7455095.1 phage holin family protein [Leuconostoc fallax]MCO6183370.1 phage holin family protein [Leuconostoc fallax]TDG69660.1 hypothetical protein C5L23_001122 [Leuconostoc fallax]
MRLLARLAINVLLFLVLSTIFENGFRVDNWRTALIAAIVLGILNAIIKPIISLFALPLTIITFGLFALVINGLMLDITANLVSGFEFASFGWAMFIAFLLSVVNMLLTSDVHVTSGRD